MTNLTVSKKQQSNFTTIYDALENCDAHDSIEIASGIYDEVLVVRKNLHIIGKGNVVFLQDIVVAPDVQVIFENIQFNGFIELKQTNVQFIQCAFQGALLAPTVQSEQSHLHFENCQFTIEKQSTFPYVSLLEGNLVLQDCHFTGNYSAIDATGSQLLIQQTMFSDQTIHLQLTDCKATIQNSRFHNGEAGISANETTLTVERSFFHHHTKLPQIHLIQSNLTLAHSQFKRAQQHLLLEQSHLSVQQCHFSQSRKTQIDLQNLSTANISDTEFSFSDESALKGDDCIVTLSNVQIHHHLGEQHPQIALNNGQLKIETGKFYSSQGAAIVAHNDSEVKLSHCSFAAHKETAIQMDSGELTIANADFQTEFADTVYLENGVKALIQTSTFSMAKLHHLNIKPDTTITVSDCQFERCGDVAILAENSHIQLQKVMLTNHSANVPAISLSNCQFQINHSTIANCHDTAIVIDNNAHGSLLQLTLFNNAKENIRIHESEVSLQHLHIDGGEYGIHSFKSRVSLSNTTIQHTTESGIYTIENGHLLLSKASLRNNAVGIQSEYCTISIEQTKFERNTTGATMHASTVTIQDGNFYKNKLFGLSASSGSLTIQNSLFSQNEQTQFEATLSNIQLSNCTFQNGGIGLCLKNKSQVTATDVGWQEHDGNSVVIQNSTMLGSRTQIEDGLEMGVVATASQLTFTNSKFYGHQSFEFHLEQSSHVTLTDCQLESPQDRRKSASILDDSTLSVDGYMMYRRRSL